jgi:hypothetical protein
MKVGDLVKISFLYEGDEIGIFIENVEYHEGNKELSFITRSRVLWEGEPTSFPTSQLEVISESR